MSKQTKYVVAVVLKNKSNPEEFLVVKRPEDDPDLGGHWGFPAATMKPGELAEGMFEVKAKSIDDAIDLLSQDKPNNLEGQFIQKRDLAFLKAAKEQL